MKKQTNDWKERLGVVYSTNPDYSYSSEGESEEETFDKKKQNLRVMLDRKQRKGKEVTLVTGFVGKEDDLKEMGRLLKTRCGTGGTVKDGEILLQGDFCSKVLEILQKEGYKAKRAGG